MCKKGDIILVNNYYHDGIFVSKHSFVVLEDKRGQVWGVDYDFVALVMSSFDTAEHKSKKMVYPATFPIVPSDEFISSGNTNKSGYIKADQFYFFDKTKIIYRVIGYIVPEIFELLLEFIQEISADGIQLKQILDNLKT